MAERRLRRQLILCCSILTSASSLLTLDDILEIFDQAPAPEHLVQPRNLDEPSDVVRDELVVDDPFRELVPFLQITYS
jgi:hypothetical protein